MVSSFGRASVMMSRTIKIEQALSEAKRVENIVIALDAAREWVPREVTLPPSAAGWSVHDEAGEVVCRHCRTFACALAPGQAAAFVVELESAA